MERNEQVVGTSKSSLASAVSISRKFLRSVRIDTDLKRSDALSGYVCQGTSRSLLENMARQISDTRQRAFTWTGPYGGGKSSLALMLCSLVGGNESLRADAKRILDLPSDSIVYRAFDATGDGWCVIPVVGKRASVINELDKALSLARGAAATKRKYPDVVAGLVATAEAHPQGVLVVIDELGKLLEATARDGDDIYIFQELAEAASRCNGKLIIVGILHQAFEAYASRLGRDSRDEWAKVQGRFVDIPLVSATDEVVELIGRAIERDSSVDSLVDLAKADIVADAMLARRPGTPEGMALGLAKCWPLHPITAALLGPISKRRFGQNERSTFGFLASREPLGFAEFLHGAVIGKNSLYDPAHYWDYLKANLEPAIIASPDGHRWAVACDAVERAEAKGDALHVALTKVVALIEMFRSGSGIVPEEKILSVSISGVKISAIHQALNQLISWKILIERKHLGAYGIYAGSDFDVDGAISQARYEIGSYSLAKIAHLTNLQPILAKRLYQETGTMRWFNRQIIQTAAVESCLKGFSLNGGNVGAFILCLPEVGQEISAAKRVVEQLSRKYENLPVLFGVPSNAEKIADLALELAASERVVSTRPELEGDSVAKRELTGRVAAVGASLEEELADAFDLSTWYYQGVKQAKDASVSLAMLASKIAQEVYYKAPRVLNELINRESLSSNSTRARKDLMYRMLSHFSEENLGYENFPADAGLYYSILQGCGLHFERKGGWGFGSPNECVSGVSLAPLWWDTENLVLRPKFTTLTDIYSIWQAPPYGVRAGLVPVLALAFFLSHRSELALYVDGMFVPDVSEASIDEWLVDPGRVKFQFIEISKDKEKLVAGIAALVPAVNQSSSSPEPLDAARGLVSMIFGLPSWTKRTSSISDVAQNVRAMLLKANDPHKVLFTDLPILLNAQSSADLILRLEEVVSELISAYSLMLQKVNRTLLVALDHEGRPLKLLQARAVGVKGITGDLLLDAFATRLESYDGGSSGIEMIISLATNKPPAQWVDRDIDAALLKIGDWAIDLRKAEVMAPLRGRPASRRMIGVVFGARNGYDVSGSIDISETDVPAVDELVKRVLATVHEENRDIVLAALAEAGALLMGRRHKEHV